MEPTPEPLRVLLQHVRPKVKPVRSIEKFCGILMKLLDGSGERLAATQILNRSSNNSQCQALLWPNVSSSETMRFPIKTSAPTTAPTTIAAVLLMLVPLPVRDCSRVVFRQRTDASGRTITQGLSQRVSQ